MSSNIDQPSAGHIILPDGNNTPMDAETFQTVADKNLPGIREQLYDLAIIIHKGNKDRGFWDNERPFSEKIALVHSELSEALEIDRKDKTGTSRGFVPDDKLQHQDGRAVELADAMIRIIDMAMGFNLDLAGALVDKVYYNSLRPHRHGKQY